MSPDDRDGKSDLHFRFLIAGFLAIGLTAFLLIFRFVASEDRAISADIHVYYLSSRWIVSSGRLFIDFPSEYPLFANLWFAIPRVFAIPFGSDLRSYTIIYVLVAASLYGLFFYYAINFIDRRNGECDSLHKMQALSAGLLLSASSPVILQLVMLRYDVLPATLIFFALFALSSRRLYLSAVLFGFAIAAKVYPIVYFPAVVAYAMHIAGRRAAFHAALLSLLPFVSMSAITLGLVGVEGFLSPFLFQANRSFDGASVYGFLIYIFDPQTISVITEPSVKVLTIALSISGSLFVRGSVSSLVRVAIFQTYCLLLISPITSPQFLIWMVPLVICAMDRHISLLFISFAWISNFWFVLETDMPEGVFEIILFVNLVMKLGLVMFSARDVLATKA